MKLKGLTALGVASAAAIAWHAPALADDSIEERLSRMEQRIRYLEERVAAQDQVIVEKDREIAALSAGEGDAWYNRVEIGGAIELEAVSSRDYAGDRSTEGSLATLEIGLAAPINDTVSADILVENDDGDIVLADGFLTFAPADTVSISAGQQGLPFGVFETNMVSDPMTKELGDTSGVSVVAEIDAGLATVSLFGFDGANEPHGKSRIESFGAALGHSLEQGGFAIDLGVSWINDIGEAGGLQEALTDNLAGFNEDTAAAVDEANAAAEADAEQAYQAALLEVLEDNDPTTTSADVVRDTVELLEAPDDITYSDPVAGFGASIVVSVADITVIGEYVTATENFEASEIAFRDAGAEPSAMGFEVAYGFDLAGSEATFALGYQETDQAVALELPRERVLGALSVGIMENVTLAFEWARDDDYSVRDGGTDEEADTVTLLLGAEF